MSFEQGIQLPNMFRPSEIYELEVAQDKIIGRFGAPPAPTLEEQQTLINAIWEDQAIQLQENGITQLIIAHLTEEERAQLIGAKVAMIRDPKCLFNGRRVDATMMLLYREHNWTGAELSSPQLLSLIPLLITTPDITRAPLAFFNELTADQYEVITNLTHRLAIEANADRLPEVQKQELRVPYIPFSWYGISDNELGHLLALRQSSANYLE